MREKKNTKFHFCQAPTLGAKGRQQAAMGDRCPPPSPQMRTPPSSSSSPTQLYLKATFGISPSSVPLKLKANTPKQQTELRFV